ncbi:ABC transporter ATP-binding protein [Clavibacter michiganensis]|uniref:ABC transporter ATP-binding protein n=1 Tax=Clavibacter michiganensis TaxID=28447 RepID=UPI000CE7794E|nr:ABC transporter ATP-binding protein [Clavibacter michiganensis]PPF91262.1 ABC transporter ATP-binding protein [Clavibacter michiganensis]PPF99304.1 ABC transporter ATP-binding protein [Clavibacter michiganensis]
MTLVSSLIRSRPLPLLRARGLTLSFGATHALRGVDVDIERGEIVAVMGPSGSGKSTLIHVLGGVLAPDEGEVFYRGVCISELGEAARSRIRLSDFGFVFQFGQLLPELTALDNVTIPLMLGGMPRRLARARALMWLEELDVVELAGKLPTRMSGGEAQLVAIARALSTEPTVLFADEPTGALDSLVAETVMETLTTVSRSNGTALVIVTHDARTASYSDREIMVRDGRALSRSGADDTR